MVSHELWIFLWGVLGFLTSTVPNTMDNTQFWPQVPVICDIESRQIEICCESMISAWVNFLAVMTSWRRVTIVKVPCKMHLWRVCHLDLLIDEFFCPLCMWFTSTFHLLILVLHSSKFLVSCIGKLDLRGHQTRAAFIYHMCCIWTIFLGWVACFLVMDCRCLWYHQW